MDVPRGVWTPVGTIACLQCHDTSLSSTHTFEEWEAYLSPVEVKDGNGVTPCDFCNKLVQVRENVAKENNLALELTAAGIRAAMAQMGGMMSACVIPAIDGGQYICTFNLDGDRCYSISRVEDDEFTPAENHEDVIVETPQDAVEYIANQADI